MFRTKVFQNYGFKILWFIIVHDIKYYGFVIPRFFHSFRTSLGTLFSQEILIFLR
jgi:hypothetical protein